MSTFILPSKTRDQGRLSFCVLTAKDWPLYFLPLAFETFFLFQNISPSVTGASPGVESSLFLQSPSWVWLPFFFFFSFSFLSPLCYPQITLCLSSSATVHQVLCGHSTTCLCILDVLVGKGEPQILLSCNLDPRFPTLGLSNTPVRWLFLFPFQEE